MQAEWFSRELKKVRELRTRIKQAKLSVREEKAELAQARTNAEHAVQAQALLSALAGEVQRKAHKRIASVVSSCLSVVFDEPYEFKIEFELKRGKTEARLTFVRDGLELDPMDAAGGGAVDVAAFALRAACLVLHRPRLRKLLLLDEPFKFVSSEFQPAVRTMLEKLSNDLGIQMVMVTHNEAFETGKVIEI